MDKQAHRKPRTASAEVCQKGPSVICWRYSVEEIIMRLVEGQYVRQHIRIIIMKLAQLTYYHIVLLHERLHRIVASTVVTAIRDPTPEAPLCGRTRPQGHGMFASAISLGRFQIRMS